MSGVLKDIWRHPLKSHGRENLQSVKLSVGQSLPWDRHWAVAHDSAKKDIDSNGWMSCLNFSRGSKAPELMAINASFDERLKELTLTHPKIGNNKVQARRERRSKKVY